MIIPTKKLRNGFEIPVFGLGTWEMGGRMEHDPRNDDQRDINAIRAAIDAGVTHIDTAEKYAEGYSETLLGKAIQNYDRSKLFIASKVASQNLRHNDLIASCEASLKRVNTEYFDLYMIHSPSLETPIKESMKAMDHLMEKGLIRNIGVSNFPSNVLKELKTTQSIRSSSTNYISILLFENLKGEDFWNTVKKTMSCLSRGVRYKKVY